MARWLELLKSETSSHTKHPEVPQFGFGDPTSYRIIQQAVTALKLTGAVRHGAGYLATERFGTRPTFFRAATGPTPVQP